MNKKLFLGGLVALSGAAMFVSCGDDNAYDSSVNRDVLVYEAAFVKTFGQPSPNQDWGFGTNSTRALTRAITATPDFSGNKPAQPSFANFNAVNFAPDVANVPVQGSFSNGAGKIDATYTGDINIWTPGSASNPNTLYVIGSHDYTNKNFYVANNTDIYLLENASLTIPKQFQGGCKVYIGKNATLNINTDITNGNISYYNNGGRINVSGNWYIGDTDQTWELASKNGSITIGGMFMIQKDAIVNLDNTQLSIGGNLELNDAVFYYKGKDLTTATTSALHVTDAKYYSDGYAKFASLTVDGANTTSYFPSVVYNDGTMEITGHIGCENGGSLLVNDGSLTGASMNTAGSSSYWNASGQTTITGNTVVNSNGNGWVNDAVFNTNNFSYTAGSVNVFNNCTMNVSNLFYIDLGDTPVNGFQMNSDCSVVTRNFHGDGPFFIHMGGGSLFKVTETATMNATKAHYGIYGDGTTHAVFQANKIVKGTEKQGFEVTYGGNLYIYATESHFEQGHDGDPTHPFIAFEGNCSASNIYAPNFESGKPNIKINKTGCNPGFEGDDGGDEHVDEFIPVIRVMGEDLSISDNSENYEADFDFNDVVFDVMWTSTGAKIRLVAAGGTLPLYVGGQEIHAKFAEVNPNRNISTTTVINATNKTEYAPAIYDITGNFKNADGDYDANLIPVYVKKNGQDVELKALRGKVASKIAVDPKVSWPNENQFIQNVYPNFSKWVKLDVSTFY